MMWILKLLIFVAIKCLIFEYFHKSEKIYCIILMLNFELWEFEDRLE